METCLGANRPIVIRCSSFPRRTGNAGEVAQLLSALADPRRLQILTVEC